VDPSSEKPDQLPSSNGVQRTIEQKPATVSVTAGASVLTDIGDNNITARAEYIRYSSDETMIWQEVPSPVLLIRRAIRYIILLIIIFAACSGVKYAVSRVPVARATLEQYGVHVLSGSSHTTHRQSHKSKGGHRAADAGTDASAGTAASADDNPSGDTGKSGNTTVTLEGILLGVKAVFIVLFLLLFLVYWLKLKATKYSASSQRLIVEQGFWHSVNRAYELHQLGDAVIYKPALLRLFNVSNLVIVDPHIELYGLRNAEYVRDVLRQSGQIEASRADKIHWR
jgi:hypothetical protein